MKKDTSKSTMLVISMGFLILYLLFFWQWAVITSLIVGIVGIISGTLSRIIEKWWMELARILSYIIPSILLGIVFYLFLFPISLISKLFTKDPLMLSNKYKTYFVTINKEVDKKSFEKIW
jgi:ABC-type dipeptide/oligopeptide/nickel transport system permease subunit